MSVYVAALLFLLTAGAPLFCLAGWWAIGILATAASMVAIVPSWTDARLGVQGNVIAFVGVVSGFLPDGPVSQRAAYGRQVAQRLSAPLARTIRR